MQSAQTFIRQRQPLLEVDLLSVLCVLSLAERNAASTAHSSDTTHQRRGRLYGHSTVTRKLPEPVTFWNLVIWNIDISAHAHARILRVGACQHLSARVDALLSVHLVDNCCLGWRVGRTPCGGKPTWNKPFSAPQQCTDLLWDCKRLCISYVFVSCLCFDDWCLRFCPKLSFKVLHFFGHMSVLHFFDTCWCCIVDTWCCCIFRHMVLVHFFHTCRC